MLNKPFFNYWARMFLLGSVGEMIYGYFYPEKSFSPPRILILSFILAAVIYFITEKDKIKKKETLI